MNDRKETTTEADSCGCGSGAKINWIWVVIAIALAAAVFGKLAGKGPSACGGGVCPFQRTPAVNNDAPAVSK